jgi:DNA-binding transcriptional LysR family regulator
MPPLTSRRNAQSLASSDWVVFEKAIDARIVDCSRLLFDEVDGDSRADDGRGLNVFRVVTCDTIGIIAGLAGARGGAAAIPEAMVAASGSELESSHAEGGAPVLPLNICAMWREDASRIEYTDRLTWPGNSARH